MNYELAKDLEDAGFPYKGNKWMDSIYSSGVVPEYEPLTSTMTIEKEQGQVRVPTLSELIEACGDGTAVIRLSDHESNAWTKQRYHPDDGPLSCTGSTLEEAVARLYIALNKE